MALKGQWELRVALETSLGADGSSCGLDSVSQDAVAGNSGRRSGGAAPLPALARQGIPPPTRAREAGTQWSNQRACNLKLQTGNLKPL